MIPMRCIRSTVALLLAALLLGGCARTRGPEAMVPTVDEETYFAMTDAERDEYDAKVGQATEIWARYRRVNYLAGREVCWGPKETQRCMLWDQENKQVDVYPRHSSGGVLGTDMSKAITFATNGTGEILTQDDGRGNKVPIVIHAHGAASDTPGRFILGGLMRIAGAAANGVGAAAIQAGSSGCSGGGCGGAPVVVGTRVGVFTDNTTTVNGGWVGTP